jgi:hypothetical protein
MKTIGTLVVVFLAMSPVAIVNAQTSSSSPSGLVSQQDLKAVKTQIQRQAGQIKGLKGDVRGLMVEQENERGQISTVRNNALNQEVEIAQGKNATKAVEKSVSETQARTSRLSYLLTTVFCVLVLFISGGVYFVRRWARTRKLILEKQDELQRQILDIQQLKEVVHVNPDVITLRALCKELRDKDPRGDHRVTFTYRLSPKPEKGFMEGGEIECLAEFDESLPVDDQQPKILHAGNVLKHKNLPRYTARVLGLQPDQLEDGEVGNLAILPGCNFGEPSADSFRQTQH